MTFGSGVGRRLLSNLAFFSSRGFNFFPQFPFHPTEAVPSDDTTPRDGLVIKRLTLPRLRRDHAAKPRREAVAAVVAPGVTQEATAHARPQHSAPQLRVGTPSAPGHTTRRMQLVRAAAHGHWTAATTRQTWTAYPKTQEWTSIP